MDVWGRKGLVGLLGSTFIFHGCIPGGVFNERLNVDWCCSYGLDLFLLSIDEGISGYRDDSLETVKRNEKQYGLKLTVVSYKELYGWTMDEIVKEIGTKNNCTFCGVFRRQVRSADGCIAISTI